ncbi:dynactin P62 subunit [Culex quinquefasciatus]|uniref:Dynactin P62 subunit n=1 Tax=Culex quinquefasciatus TaxID=7176 RepID=B0XBK9_CULQU|nr:dynactin P62 subunit [Culex quinquefasciatus]|eukprot:XP_001867031.1 dynactin P62 subunit [Culex quinquefasciatus]
MGVRKRPTEKEQLLDKHERSDLRVDWDNIAILFFLYLLQGILMGLVAAILMMLQNRGASYKQQVRVECWAGDASYLDEVVEMSCRHNAYCGRRSSTRCTGLALAGASWLIPTQYLMELFMLILSLHGDLFGTAAVVWFTPAMIYDLHVPYYYYLILLTKYGLYQIALYSMFVAVIVFFTRNSGRRRNVHDTAQHAKQSGRKLAQHRGAVDGRRADVAATAGEEGKKEEPPTAGNQWRQCSGRSRSTRMRLDLDCCCRLRRKIPKTSKFLSLADRTGVTVSMILRQMVRPQRDQVRVQPELDQVPHCDVRRVPRSEGSLHPERAAHVQPEGHPFAEANQSNHQRHDHHDNGTEPNDEEERRMIEELKLSAEATISSSSSSLMLVGRGVE